MWNVNIKRGAVWSTKSRNEYDECFEGMTFGTSYVLILTAFVDEDDIKKFTYFKVSVRQRSGRLSQPIIVKGTKMYVEIDYLCTGDQRCLATYQDCVGFQDLNNLVDLAKSYFNLTKQKPTVNYKPKQPEPDISEMQQRIQKFGIDIFVTPNEDVTITESKKIILSDKAKDDIIYNSKTDEDIRVLCDKYKIYPLKAIKEIKYRLVYQHRQKEG